MQTRNIKFFETSLKRFSSYSFLEIFIESTQGPITTVATIQNRAKLVIATFRCLRKSCEGVSEAFQSDMNNSWIQIFLEYK